MQSDKINHWAVSSFNNHAITPPGVLLKTRSGEFQSFLLSRLWCVGFIYSYTSFCDERSQILPVKKQKRCSLSWPLIIQTVLKTLSGTFWVTYPQVNSTLLLHYNSFFVCCQELFSFFEIFLISHTY